ncbi:MAG: LuxR C-terminal-related transcriptional regulator [Parasulfuritortus sp.]|nr:LuxR C-terminal-related transcriptional regulator [Parasulfuritortus sp.]
MTAELIDRIYECSVVPELWPDVLDKLAHLVDASGGLLFSVRERVLNWTSSSTLCDVFQSYVNDGWFSQCTRRVCLFSKNQPTFLVEHDFWTQEELDENPIYRDFFRPRGLGWSAGTGLMMPTGDNIVFSIERQFTRGPIEDERVQALNELRPHLARAALIAARLGLRSAKGANDTLAVLGLPALVMDESGVVIEANALMAGLSEHVQWHAYNRISLTDEAANSLLLSSLPALKATADASVNSFAIRDKNGQAAMVAHIVPIRRSAHDIFGHSYALLIVTPVTSRKAPPVELLRSLFDLTPSEARVARALATGESLDDIATSGSVTRNTVRSQLQQVMEKMGCTRQAEVTALLANIALGSKAPMQ